MHIHIQQFQVIMSRKNKILKASVFCYVSEDFDGTWAMLTSEGAVVGIKEAEYNWKVKVHGRNSNLR